MLLQKVQDGLATFWAKIISYKITYTSSDWIAFYLLFTDVAFFNMHISIISNPIFYANSSLFPKTPQSSSHPFSATLHYLLGVR